MIIIDNNIRWNSIYFSIMRGLKFKTKFQYYFMNNKKELNADYFEKAD